MLDNEKEIKTLQEPYAQRHYGILCVLCVLLMLLYTAAGFVDSEYVFSHWIPSSELLLRFKMKRATEEEGKSFAEKNRNSRYGGSNSFDSGCSSDDSRCFSTSRDDYDYSKQRKCQQILAQSQQESSVSAGQLVLLSTLFQSESTVSQGGWSAFVVQPLCEFTLQFYQVINDFVGIYLFRHSFNRYRKKVLSLPLLITFRIRLAKESKDLLL